MNRIKIGFILAITTSLYFVYSLSLSNDFINKEVSSDKLVKNKIIQTSKSLRAPADAQVDEDNFAIINIESVNTSDIQETSSDQEFILPTESGEETTYNLTSNGTTYSIKIRKTDFAGDLFYEVNITNEIGCNLDLTYMVSEIRDTTDMKTRLMAKKNDCQQSNSTNPQKVATEQDDQSNNQNTEIDQLLSEIATLATGGNHQTAHERYEALKERVCEQNDNLFCKEMETLRELIDNSKAIQEEKKNIQTIYQQANKDKSELEGRSSLERKQTFNRNLDNLIHQIRSRFTPSRIIDAHESGLPEKTVSIFKSEFNNLLENAPQRFEVAISNNRNSLSTSNCTWDGIKKGAQCESSPGSEPRLEKTQNITRSQQTRSHVRGSLQGRERGRRN